MKIFNLTGFIISVLLIHGCATVTTGSNQTITVETEPPGAACKMVRDNETIGVINPTPGSVTIGKDKDEVGVNCELSGYLTTTHTFDSTFQGATLGNILLGGLIGIVIDAGSGAMNEYPASIFVRMQADEFTNEQERDKYFDSLAAELNGNTDRITRGKRYACSTRTCEKKLMELNEQREEELAKIELARNEARIKNE